MFMETSACNDVASIQNLFQEIGKFILRQGNDDNASEEEENVNDEIHINKIVRSRTSDQRV